MAKGERINLLDSTELETPKTRKGVNESVLSKLRQKYGLNKDANVHAALYYGNYLRRHRVYSSKAGGYIHNESSRYAGQKWDEKAIRAELKADSSVALKTHRAAHPLAIAGRKFGGALQRINKFSNAQDARNALNQHLQAKAQNWWQVRNLASEIDSDTGLRLYELDYNKKTKLLQDRVNALENIDISQPYEAPSDALKIIEPEFKISGHEVGRIVGGDTSQVPLTPQGGGVDNTVTVSDQDGSTAGSAQVTGDTEGHVGNSDSRQNSNQTVSNNAVDNNVDQLRTWRRGTGESISDANDRTEQWLTKHGVDINQISKHDRSGVYRDLRIRGPHIVNGNIMLNTMGRGANSRFSLKINRDI